MFLCEQFSPSDHPTAETQRPAPGDCRKHGCGHGRCSPCDLRKEELDQGQRGTASVSMGIVL